MVGLTGSGIGTALGVPMLWPRTARPLAVRLMGGWLMALSAVAAIISARVIGLLPGNAAVEHAVNLLGFCAYPLLYLYVREQTRQARQVRDAWWLSMPAIVYVAVLATRTSTGR